MGFFDSFKLAIKGLLTSKMRAFLTMLGIIIGVGAVIIIMSLGNGLQLEMNSTFESIGTNTLNVNLFDSGSTRNASVDDMYDFFLENNDFFKAMSPTVTVSATVKVKNDTETPAITGVGEDYLTIKDWDVVEGRNIQYLDIERRQNVCVVGAYFNAEEMFNGKALGNTIKINGNLYKIIGVVDEISNKNDEDGSDNMVLIPYSNATIISKDANITSYTFISSTDDNVATAKQQIKNFLYKQYGNEDSYMVVSMAEMLEMLTTLTDTFVTVLAAIAAISLLVGGIGIMNIMLVSVSERTREIGIRKALGAKRRDIRSQFVIEAGTTSSIGGIFGIIAGYFLAQIAGNALGITAVPTASSILISFGVSVAIGVAFGFLPANNAAMLNPIDALRYD